MIWVAARIRGTRLLIAVQENMDSMPQEEDTSDPKPSDLVATKSGEIMQMVTRQGIPQAQQDSMGGKGRQLEMSS